MTKNPSPKGQLELGIQRQVEKDRNHHLGGRSFYFFDFDDNIAFLSTPLILFHKATGQEKFVTSGEYAKIHPFIGTSGPYADYEVRFDDTTGTYRNFRDRHPEELEKIEGQKQIFIQDLAHALGFPDVQWKGPSWQCFFHATFNRRPMSVITARGHDPQTLKDGIRIFVDKQFLPHEPNYLSLFPVNHKPTRHLLGDVDLTMSAAQLKQKAIRASVERAIDVYGHSPHHRFGMSDDDPKNIELILAEMTRLKSDYPEMSFFMIETHDGNFVKHEVTLAGPESKTLDGTSLSQLPLFEADRHKS
ncbi:MAG: hypothetical protein IPM97_12260 [Bdellovibrionaceae bacterium]|nr:hypothetical protein [Pseudobdellovibrionaceae bacterium]